MNVDKLIRNSELFLKRHSSTILTCIGAAGVVATGVLAATATPKALMLLEEAKEEKGEELTKVETVITVAPVYIPAVLTGVSTIACIFGANALNKRSQASLMSAYALLNNSYKEYREKVTEIHGEEAEKNIRHEIVKDKYEEQTLKYSDDLFTLNWYQNDFAYGTENGEKYHKLTCSTLMNSNVVYGNTIEMWKRNLNEKS